MGAPESPLGTGCGTVAPTVPAGSCLLVYCGESRAQGLPRGIPSPGAAHPRGFGAEGRGFSRSAPLSTHFQVTLAALCLAASELQPPGWRDRAVLRRQQVLVQPILRLRRHTDRRPCPDGMNWIEATRQCCSQCPAGTFMSEPCTSLKHRECRPCPAGTFRTQPNTLRKCQACYECDRQAFQSVLSNCSATSNIACGCEPGRFRVCLDKQCSEFSCQKCQSCTGRLIQRPCSEAQDTLCDSSCKPDFYREGDECRPCHMSTQDTCGKECQQVCGSNNNQGSGLEYILLGLTGPLFLGALAIYHKRKRFWHDVLAGGPHPTAQAATSVAGAAGTPCCQFNAQRWHNLCWTQPCSPQGTERAAGTAKQSPKHPLLPEPPSDEGEPSAPLEPRGALLQGSQLYAVIDVVPVRRWKEFMRMLELREAEIELVELEVAHIRDQQYEMLKRWCQQTSATLDHVFAALERMELAGCAEALRQSLPLGP
ncbi:tumor necrosis factor receptor superfamily member 25 isoform X1 [Vidua macroura]|uniref:tumor necrosis factor receptor superfamily member 25 isoform X1 n=1 Tax=Vidua macroura TaxID=187451 RepID=UPI0023A90F49|nr:tumor necrosis factor receptor superfamily member 25 isoform X1 [Vidua macroura]